ncbi:Na+/H+ antiporter nhaA [Roseomonas mucosa]|uniref:Na+/H+ antiporter nhaA n=1 Tax=Roseomonas mucosa TaxID=207340 RepID=A0A4Y1MS31_9PROT|nr:Na+/H+ antiporter nhaA [Roseomonas mucosa]
MRGASWLAAGGEALPLPPAPPLRRGPKPAPGPRAFVGSGGYRCPAA